jgi:DNA polymerase-3 subunit epsilon
MTFMGWVDEPLCGISIETTGGDDETARIVAAGMVFVGDKTPRDPVSLLIDPGVPVPAAAAARHGITTERVQAQGIAAADGLRRFAAELERWWLRSRPVIGYGLLSTLTVLDREMRRHLGRGLAVSGPVVDPQVIDRAMDRRSRPRSLAEDCRYYGVRYDRPHEPVPDALAAARLAWKLARRYPGKVGSRPLLRLYQDQQDWGWRQAARDAGLPHTGRQSARNPWPLRPCSWINPQWDQRVIGAIHRAILAGWEQSARRDQSRLFRTELHIVNDTRDPQWDYSSVRARPARPGHDDTLVTIMMGLFAGAKAADRVVIAWEPFALRAATGNLDGPPEEEKALQILDVVVGVPVRLSTHPYPPPGRPAGDARFSWHEPRVTDHPAGLPPVITAMIEAWRLPDPAPESDSARNYSFRTMEFDVWDTPRPR